MSIDSIGNFLTRIRNAVLVGKPAVTVPYSKMNESISAILLDEGFIQGIRPFEEKNKKSIEIALKYVEGESVIHEITRISKPSRRIYERAKQFKPVIGNLGVSIISTNQGLMTNKKAKQQNIGGEIICSVW